MKNVYLLIAIPFICISTFVWPENSHSQHIRADSNWFVQNSSTTRSLRDVFFVNDTMGWVVGDAGTILITINGGKSWYEQNSGSNNRLSDVFFTDDKNGWVTQESGKILATNNSGLSWYELNYGPGGRITDFYFWNKDIGWCTSYYTNDPPGSRISRTTDGGYTWNEQFNDTTYELKLFGLCFLDSLRGWATGYVEYGIAHSGGAIYRTTDGGDTWKLMNDSLKSITNSVQFVNDSIGWVVGGATGYIAKSTNGGATWITQRIDIPEWYWGLYFTNNYTGWVVGSEANVGYILKTIDGGDTWEYQSEGEFLPLSSICFTNDYYGWAAGTQGQIIHTESGGEEVYVDPYGRNKLNKAINDFQTTEDNLFIGSKRNGKEAQSLINVEVLLDTIFHTSDSDLEITLSHAGVTETLVYQAGGNGDNFTGTKLTDNAIDHISNGSAPFSGSYKPENALSAFNGVNPTGNWTLSIYDGASGNTGVLNAWGIVLIYDALFGVEDAENESIEFEILPNPAKDKFKVKSLKLKVESSTIEIYDLNGRKLIEKNLPRGTEIVEINVSNLKGGVYCCKVSTAEKSTTKKLIIQK